jgi:2-polyprenyl-6-methoxyphenol hydroxylase-like FAD-dependent oxidoreductase
MKPRYYMRPAVGAGWALVEDAAIREDPVSGLGINHALRDSRALAEALLRGDELSLRLFGVERDHAVLPEWHMGNELGSTQYAHALARWSRACRGASPLSGGPRRGGRRPELS